MRRVYLDSCVVIYYVERHPELGARIEAALLPAAGDAPVLVTCELARMECRVHPLREHNTELLARYDAFFALPAIERVPLDTAVFDLATELRAVHGIKAPDALHLAAALHARCDEFWTHDERLARAAASAVAVVNFTAVR